MNFKEFEFNLLLLGFKEITFEKIAFPTQSNRWINNDFQITRFSNKNDMYFISTAKSTTDHSFKTREFHSMLERVVLETLYLKEQLTDSV